MAGVRAKFRVDNRREFASGKGGVELFPVSSGSEENKQFYSWTPGGRIELVTINPDVVQFFEPGKEYYVDFTKAEDPADGKTDG